MGIHCEWVDFKVNQRNTVTCFSFMELTNLVMI